MGHYHEAKFQEIESRFFQEIKSFSNIWQFWSRGWHFDQEVDTSIRRSKALKCSLKTFDLLKKLLATSSIMRLKAYEHYLDFWSPEQFCWHNFDHEIESIQI